MLLLVYIGDELYVSDAGNVTHARTVQDRLVHEQVLQSTCLLCVGYYATEAGRGVALENSTKSPKVAVPTSAGGCIRKIYAP